MYMIKHEINMTSLLSLNSIFLNKYMRILETSLHPCHIYAVFSILMETEHNLSKSSSISLLQK